MNTENSANVSMANHRMAEFHKVSVDQYQTDSGNYIDLEYDQIKLPKRATELSAGYDFFSPIDFTLKPNETIKIATGIRCFMERGWFLMIVPRSGLGFKYRCQIDNTVGIIDADYFGSSNEGHIMIKLTNDSRSGKVMEIKAGQAIAQGIFVPYGITYDDAADGKRDGGFGSTDGK